MFKILVVDDVVHERDVINFLIKKNNFPLEISTAPNGKDALNILRNNDIDILFTDIQMPFINGIDLANEVRTLYPHIEIVFFSGYDDFQYVKKALSLRAVNYILKPVKQDEFKKTISCIIETLNRKNAIKKSEDDKVAFIKNNILYQIISGTPINIIKDRYPTFNLEYINQYTRFFLLKFNINFFNDNEASIDINMFYSKILEVLSTSVSIINLNPSKIVILFFKEYTSDECYIMAEKLHKTIHTLTKEKCFISISDSIKNAYDLNSYYNNAEIFLQKHAFNSNQYIYSNDFNDTKLTPVSSSKDAEILKKIEKYIELQDGYELKESITNFLDSYDDAELSSPIYIKFSCSNIIKTLLSNNHEKIYEVTEKIFSYNHFYEIKEIVLDTLKYIINNFDENSRGSKHSITLVKKYIHDNYNEDLSLDILAEKVFLTPKYLSTLFIEETGCGLSKYIKDIRMSHAKNLILNSNMKISEICKTVGYRNVSYFCKSFQSEFGITPEKFRSKKN